MFLTHKQKLITQLFACFVGAVYLKINVLFFSSSSLGKLSKTQIYRKTMEKPENYWHLVSIDHKINTSVDEIMMKFLVYM